MKSNGINEMSTAGVGGISNLAEISSSDINTAVRRSSEVGTPIFTAESIKETSRPLAQLLRFIFVTQNITVEKYSAAHEKLALATCMAANVKTSEKNNLRRAMDLPDVTYHTFEKVLHVCGLEMANLTVTLTDRNTGEVLNFSLQDVIKFLNENTVPLNTINQVVP